MTSPVWTDDPRGLSQDLAAFNEPNIGTEKNPLGTVYARSIVADSQTIEGGQVVEGALTVEGVATAESVAIAGSDTVLDEDGLVVDQVAQSVQTGVTAAG